MPIQDLAFWMRRVHFIQYDFHQTSSNLSLYQNVFYSIVLEAFNSLPQSIKNLSDNPK
jgi:hypothetical protein